MKKLNLYKLVNGITIALIIGMIVLFFCPILILSHAPSPTETNESLASPFLNGYTSATVFMLLIPLVVSLILHIVSFFVKNRILNCIELLMSIYVLSISIFFLAEYRFTVVGFVFTLFLTILMMASSIVKVVVFEYEKRRVKGN